MVTQQTIDIIKAVTPVVADNAESITKCFYPRMFAGNPEVLAYFNQAHQHDGAQQRALADAVCAYFANIDNLGVLGPAVELIAHKHAALGIQPEQYPIVGKHLLDAIGEVLGDAVTPDIAGAVGEAYGQLADIFTSREAELYQEALDKPGGWSGFRPFTVTAKKQEADGIASFTLSPTDGGPIIEHLPGQYLTVAFDVPGNPTPPRNYSISDVPGTGTYRITVKREEALDDSSADGIISNYLHDSVTEGTEVRVGPPFGVFTLDPAEHSDRPAVFIAGGIGITPLLSMAKALTATHPQTPVVFIHAVRSASTLALGDEVDALTESGRDVRVRTVVEDGSDAGAVSGRITPELLREVLPNEPFDVYLCGPRLFMCAVHQQLTGLGVPDDAIRYECFGPLQTV